MDNQFEDLKGRCHTSTTECYAKKFYERMLLVKAKWLDPKLVVPTTTISLTPADLPFIVNAPSGCPKEYSPFQACFTNEKI